MIHLIPRSRLLTQTLLLACFSFVVLFTSYNVSYSTVLQVYLAGAESFVMDTNPYQLTLEKFGAQNQFKYSPFAAILYHGLYQAKFTSAVVGLWAFLSLFVFFLGLSMWCDLTKKYPLYVGLALIACLSEVNISQSVHQTNALIAGLSLIGLAAFRKERYFNSGAALLIAANIKVMPVIFLTALALRFKLKFFLGIVAAGLLAFLIPALFVGWSHNWEMHLAWVKVVMDDTTKNGILDVQSSFTRLESASAGGLLKYSALLLSIPLFFAASFFLTSRTWVPWLTFGISALLLVNPRTDAFTYALLAPSYLLFAIWFAECDRRITRIGGGWLTTIIALAMGIGLSIYVMGDSYSDSIHPNQLIRVFGALCFWVMSGAILIHHLALKVKQRISPAQFASPEHS